MPATAEWTVLVFLGGVPSRLLGTRALSGAAPVGGA